MGCKQSVAEKPTITEDSKASMLSSYKIPMDEKPCLSESQMELIRESWKVAREDIAKVGVVTFLRLFEKHPETQNIFLPFRGLTVDELRHSARLREHGLRVMLTVEKCIARLDKPDKLEEILNDLGQKHVMFNTKVDYIDMVGPQFIQAIRPAVKDWTTEVEDAWEDFFKLVIYLMKSAMFL